jgi:hypothetical protein
MVVLAVCAFILSMAMFAVVIMLDAMEWNKERRYWREKIKRQAAKTRMN